MSLRDFLSKQFIDVIEWVEPADGLLAYRYPMQDREIQNGGKLTVRDSQMAVFVNEGKVGDVFGPGFYTLNTQTLPILTYLMNWDKAFKSPFKSDVYFFITRLQTNQHWGTQNPITIRDKEFGAIRLRAFGIYTYHLADPKLFYTKVSGTRDAYGVADLEGQLRNTIVGRITDTFAGSQVPFLDMAANQVALSEKIAGQLKPAFTDLGLVLDSFVVENLSLPGRIAEDPRPAHWHEHGRRYGTIHPVPGRAIDSGGGRKRRRRRSGSRRRPGCRNGHGTGHDGRHQEGQCEFRLRRRRARCRRDRRCRHRSQVLLELRKVDSESQQVLPQLRPGSTVTHT